MKSTTRLVLSAMVAVLSPTAAASAQSIVGTWSGTVTQAGYGSFPVSMVLSSGQSGTITYPSLNCSGTLSGGPNGSSSIFTETITIGQASETTDGCLSGGTITMTASGGDSMSWEWIGAYGGETYRVSGTLSRARPDPAGFKTVKHNAGPYNVFSPAVPVYECFGENVGAQISLLENHTNSVVRLRVRKDRGYEGEDWYEYMAGSRIDAQVIELRAASVGPAGPIVLRVEGQCCPNC